MNDPTIDLDLESRQLLYCCEAITVLLYSGNYCTVVQYRRLCNHHHAIIIMQSANTRFAVLQYNASRKEAGIHLANIRGQ